MYDTITMVLHSDKVKDKNLIEIIIPKLHKLTRLEVNDTVTFTGYLDKKLKVNVTNSRIKIPKGNLKSWYFDNAFYDFKRGSTEEAINKLEDIFELPIGKAEVTRIDIGPTLSMKHTPRRYYRHLGSAKGYKRLDMDNGITYRGKQDSFIIYHKQNQLEETGKKIPEDKKNRNHLRAESRVTKQISKYYNQKVLAEDLYNEKFYMKAIDKWQECYSNIMKRSSELNSIYPTGSSKVIIENLASIALSQQEPMKVLEMIKEWQEIKRISSKQAFDMKQKIMILEEQNLNIAPSELTQELDEKIRRAADRYK